MGKQLGDRKKFFLAMEGSTTEWDYIDIVQECYKKNVTITDVSGKETKTDPFYILKSMETYLEVKPLKGEDEAWIVIDRDQWKEEVIEKCQKWAQEKRAYHFALSTPKFEYFLLLHFEESQTIANLTKKHLIGYEKRLLGYQQQFTLDSIKVAIKRAKKEVNRRDGFCTDVHLLVEHILSCTG